MKKPGDAVGKYTILEIIQYRVPKKGRANGTPTWKARAKCQCGKERILYPANIGRKGFACRGCAKTTHGMSRSNTYHIWAGIIQRCDNPNQTEYRYYGGRGIRVCERWHDFVSFLKDMGERPTGLQIERKNQDGDYEPGNCRWVTRSENQLNRRTPKSIVDRLRRRNVGEVAGFGVVSPPQMGVSGGETAVISAETPHPGLV